MKSQEGDLKISPVSIFNWLEQFVAFPWYQYVNIKLWLMRDKTFFVPNSTVILLSYNSNGH